MISVVIPTKNSMPHLKKAIDALRRQSYRNFELIVQDGGSTDGTLEYFDTIKDLPRIDLVSAPDSGIGQAYNRGIVRSRGKFLCLAASDECLLPHSLELGLSWMNEYPSAATVYGSISIIDRQGLEMSRFTPPPFDLLKFMRCEICPSMAGVVLNRKIIGKDLFYDETMKTCPDYDFWLRLGARFSPQEIIHRPELFSTSLGDRTSMTCRPEIYEQFCKDKCSVLSRFNNEAMKRKAKTGIYSWAAKQVMQMEGVSPLAIKLCKSSEDVSLIDDAPPESAAAIKGALHIDHLDWVSRWMKSIQGGKAPWGYISKGINTVALVKERQYWVKIRMRVLAGAVGVCLMKEESIEREKIFPVSSKDLTTYFPIQHSAEVSIVFRNGGIPHSAFKLFEFTLLEEKR